MTNGWPMVPLGEVLQLQRRWIKPDPFTDYGEIGVRSFGKGIFHKSPVSGASIGNKRVLRIEPGDLVFMNVFAWEGAVAVAGPDVDGKIGSHRFATYTPVAGKTDVRFLNLYFRTRDGRELLGRVSPGSALRNRTMNLALFAEQRIPLPPLSEQRRIVARVEALAAKLSHAQERVSELADIAERDAIRHAEFRHILKVIERNWPLRKFSEVVEVNPTRSVVGLKSDSMVSFVPMSAVDDVTGRIVRSTPRPLADVAKGYTAFRDGDVIFARITPCMQNGKIAIGRNLTNGCGFGSTEFHVLRPAADVTVDWLHAYLRHRDFLALAMQHFKGTAGQQRVPAAFFQHVAQILVPSLAEQRRIVAHLNALSEKSAALKRLQQESSAELNALLPSILDRAFRGDI